MKNTLFIILVFSTFFVQAQYISDVTIPENTPPIVDVNDISYDLSTTITPGDLKNHLSILASDEYEGRETGEPGNEMAAQYIKNHFESIGLPPVKGSYFQEVQFTWESWENIGMNVNGTKYKHLWDFLAFQDKNTNSGNTKIDELVFLGYGIDDKNYSDYKKAKNKLAGKSILIYAGEPVKSDNTSRITGTEEMSDWTTNWESKLETAKKYGVKNVIIVSDNIKSLLADNRRKLLGANVKLGSPESSEEYPNNIFISTTILKDILGKNLKKVIKSRDKMISKGKSKPVTFKTDIDLTMDKKEVSLLGKNVMGYVPGTDLAEELVILSAHYDHLGKRGESIYNGADDNGSGTSTLLEIAEAYAEGLKKGIRPRRSVLFLLVTGEEKGLLGSAFYAEKPVFDLDKTIVDINVDMVGRVDAKYESNPNYIYVIGSDRLSTQLHIMNEETNQKYEQLVMDYTYNSEDDPNRYYYRSDHYNFAKNGIPAIFFFNGTHEDYHQASDTVEKINFEKMAKIARHVFHLSWQLSNIDKRIVVDGEVKS